MKNLIKAREEKEVEKKIDTKEEREGEVLLVATTQMMNFKVKLEDRRKLFKGK